MAYASDKFNESFYINIYNSDRPGYLTQFGKVYPRPGYEHRNRFVGRYFIDYIVSGKGYVEFDGERREVSAGDLVYVRKGTVLSYGTDDSEPYEKLWLGMDGPAIDSLIDCYIGKERLIIRHACPVEPFLKLKSLIASSGYDERRIMMVIFELILTAAKLPEVSHQTLSEREELAESVRQYIEDRLTERISLDDVAARFHVSKRHMLRIFKEKFGTTPGAYHSDIRLVAAVRYLTETGFPINEIASVLGYSDQSFFSTAFKKKYGVYPTAYRKAARGGNGV